jgi:hypothetical protein
MASEQAEGESVSVDLPAELAEWLHTRAEDIDVTPEVLLRQLLTSYRTTAELTLDVDGDAAEFDLGESVAATDLIEPVVGAAVDGTAGTNGTGAVDEGRVEAVAAEAAREAVAGEAAASDDRLSNLESRLEALEADLDEKIEDVRARVIEVKRDTDAKAAADHGHDAIDAVARQLAAIEADVDALNDAVSGVEADEMPTRLDEVETQIADVEDRLTTVAWVVRDLREAQEADSGNAALAELKREAAAADVSRAKCENCGEGVEIGLLTEPACPHCEATVSTVERASGFFSKPKLRVASQLTAGEKQ